MHPKWQEKIGRLPSINQTLEQLPRPNRTIGHFGCFSAGLWLLSYAHLESITCHFGCFSKLYLVRISV